MQAPSIPVPAHAAKLLTRVSEYYAKTLHQERAGLEYLSELGLTDPAMLESFGVGYSAGGFQKVLPKSGPIIDGLTALGVLLPDGSEALKGKVVIPLTTPAGEITAFHGIDTQTGECITVGQPDGMFNPTAARQHESLILVPSVLESLALWQAGVHEAIAFDGEMTPETVSMLADGKADAVTLCIAKSANDELASQLASLSKSGIAVRVAHWPEGIGNAVEFFLSGHDEGAFRALLKPQPNGSAAHSFEPEESQLDDGLALNFGERRYELRGVSKPGPSQLKATIKTCAANSAGRFYIDTFNLYVGRARNAFIGESARLFDADPAIIEREVNILIERLERWSDEGGAAGDESADTPVRAIPAADREAAEAMGREPKLMDVIACDLESLGLLGEDANKSVAYLVMTSRKMDDPLALQCLSGSGVGKSHLQDGVLSLCPEEDLVKLTSLSDRALFYKGEHSLRHKVLALEEEAGATGAAYAIRNLISAKKLTVETTGRHPLTGELQTQYHTVHGPTAVFQTTTDPESDPETRSRFILMSVDESAEQTQRILQAQRERHTLDGLRRIKQREGIIIRHHAFQRLLRPVTVINPFEPLLAFEASRLSARRDQPKYLNLILAVTFLHQMQRPWRHDPAIGDYIETTLDDIAIANELAHALFGESSNELSGPSSELLRLMMAYVQRRAAVEQKLPLEIEFVRRELREAIGWSEYQMRAHLKFLEKLEYIQSCGGRQGQLYRYRLVYLREDGAASRCWAGIKPVEQIRREAEAAGLMASNFEQNGQLRATSLKPSHEVEKPARPVNKRKPKPHRKTSGASGRKGTPLVKS